MAKTTLNLMQIAGMGTNLVIDATGKTTADLIQIVGSIGLKGGHITIAKCGSKPTADLMSIVMTYPKNVTLDLRD